MGGGYNWIDASVVCPFYKAAEGKCITCMGGVAKDSETRTTFKTTASREKYMRHFCRCSAYTTCAIAAAVSLQLGYEAPRGRKIKSGDRSEAE